MRKNMIVFIGLATLVILLLLAEWLIGPVGEAVLWGATCLNLLTFIIGSLFVWMLVSDIKEKGRNFRKNFLIFGLIGLIIFGVSVFSQVDVIKDLAGGTVTRTVRIVNKQNRSGLHGIWGLQYFVEGILDTGETIRLPVSKAIYDEMLEGKIAIAEYYPNSKRLVHFD